MATIEEDLASFAAALEEANGVVVFAYCGNLRNKKLQSQKWRKLNLERELGEIIFQKVVSSLGATLGEKEIHSYTYDDVLSHEFNYLPKNDAEAFLTKLDDAPTPMDCRLFDASEDAKNISAFLYQIQFPVDSDFSDLFLYQKVSEGKVLKGSNKFVQMVQDQEKEIHLFENKVLYLDPGVDFGLWEDHLFIFAHTGFESISGYLEATKEKAQYLFDKVSALSDVEIENFDEFQLELGAKVREIRKIAAAESREFGDHLNRDNMLEVINGFNLSINFEEQEGRLHIKSPRDKYQKRDLIDLLSGKHVYAAAGGQRLIGNSLKPYDS